LKDKYGGDSSQYKNALSAISAYGDPGKANGVTIEIGATKGGGSVALGAPTAKTKDNPNGQNITVTFASGDAAKGANLIAHEGVHVRDGSAWAASGYAASKHPLLYQSELDAHLVQASIFEGEYLLAGQRGEASGYMYRPLGPNPHLIWFPGWSDATVTGFINRRLATPPSAGGLYGITPASTTRMFSDPRPRRR
jgi:hypothetical protein